jgi:hypothetical protein
MYGTKLKGRAVASKTGDKVETPNQPVEDKRKYGTELEQSAVAPRKGTKGCTALAQGYRSNAENSASQLTVNQWTYKDSTWPKNLKIGKKN